MDKYEKALEQARNYYPDNLFLDTIFPELAESDDEKIIEKIIAYLKSDQKNLFTDIVIKEIDTWIAWLEKQKEQKPVMIQWTGKNLKEVIDFTGKSPKFGEWFKSWEDFENYVHGHGDILKLFCEDGSHYEVPIGSWIVKTPDGYNVPSVAKFVQKPAEWSEEDVSIIVSRLKDAYEETQNEMFLEDIERIKSLRHKPHWKPSEGQMEELGKAKDMYMKSSSGIASLYYDLKTKLM